MLHFREVVRNQEHISLYGQCGRDRPSPVDRFLGGLPSSPKTNQTVDREKRSSTLQSDEMK